MFSMKKMGLVLVICAALVGGIAIGSSANRQNGTEVVVKASVQEETAIKAEEKSAPVLVSSAKAEATTAPTKVPVATAKATVKPTQAPVVASVAPTAEPVTTPSVEYSAREAVDMTKREVAGYAHRHDVRSGMADGDKVIFDGTVTTDDEVTLYGNTRRLAATIDQNTQTGELVGKGSGVNPAVLPNGHVLAAQGFYEGSALPFDGHIIVAMDKEEQAYLLLEGLVGQLNTGSAPAPVEPTTKPDYHPDEDEKPVVVPTPAPTLAPTKEPETAGRTIPTSGETAQRTIPTSSQEGGESAQRTIGGGSNESAGSTLFGGNGQQQETEAERIRREYGF